MQLRVLGCSGGVGSGGQTTSFALDDLALIDAGTGVGSLPLDAMGRLQHVFLTHAHLDHVAGLAFLADNRFSLGAPTLRVHARASVLLSLRAHVFNWKIWPDFFALRCNGRPTLDMHRVSIGRTVEIPGARITPVPARHTVPACGYAVSTERATAVYSGDTTACDGFWKALNRLPRVDHLIIEVAFSDEQASIGQAAKHYTPAVLGRELQKLRHRPHIHLMHHKPGRGELIRAQCAEALASWDYSHMQGGDVIDL